MEAGEVFKLVLAVALAPFLHGVGSRLHMRPVARPFAVAYTFILLAYLSTVVEDVAIRAPMHLLQHASYLAAGVALLVACVRLRQLDRTRP